MTEGRPDPEPPAALPPRPPGLAVTLVASLLLAGLVGWMSWLHAQHPRPDVVTAPEEALALVVSRGMDLETGLAEAPAWERWLHRSLTTDGGEDLTQAIAWYEELADHSLAPAVDLHLAVLLGEDGRAARVATMTAEWESRGGLPALLAPAVRTAYTGTATPGDDELDRAAVAEAFTEPWFADRLTLAWARRVGDGALAAEAADALDQRGRRMLWRARGLTLLNVAVVAIGGLGLVLVWARRRRPGGLTVGGAVLPPPWPGRLGVAVLVRGGAAGALVLVALTLGGGLLPAWIEVDQVVLDAVTWPLMYVPLVLLARRHLLAPAALGLRDAAGLVMVPGGAARLAAMVAALLAASALGAWVLTVASGRLQLTSHWSEWFDEQLAWGSALAVISSLVGSVILAPVFEEVAFRGLLFATLRRGLALAPAAALSAAIFAVAHGYGAVGFADVFWSGVIWAWAFERTGSLLPGMLAHGLTNLLVSVSVLALLR